MAESSPVLALDRPAVAKPDASARFASLAVIVPALADAQLPVGVAAMG
jgi:hypothetical protein